jgi:hypothetical protein
LEESEKARMEKVLEESDTSKVRFAYTLLSIPVPSHVTSFGLMFRASLPDPHHGFVLYQFLNLDMQSYSSLVGNSYKYEPKYGNRRQIL